MADRKEKDAPEDKEEKKEEESAEEEQEEEDEEEEDDGPLEDAGDDEAGDEDDGEGSSGEMMTQTDAPIVIFHHFDDHDDLLMRRLKVTETIDELFHIEAFAMSERLDLEFDKIVGKEVTFSVERDGEDDRYFHGVVGSFMQIATSDPNQDQATCFDIKVYPKLWLLTLSKDCRVFQNETPIDIIKKVLEEHGVEDVDIRAEGGLDIREYCVQYNETHYDFVVRLMQEEGICFFFTHEKDKHTLVLADKDTHFEKCEGSSELDFDDSSEDPPPINTVTNCDFEEHVASIAHEANDYNMTTAGTDIYSLVKGDPEEEMLVGQVYEYSGQMNHEDIPTQERLEKLMTMRLEEQQSLRKRIYMKSVAPYLYAGGKFKFSKHHRDDLNDKTYVVHKIVHEVQSAVPEGVDDMPEEEKKEKKYLYRNTVYAFHEELPYRPRRLIKPPLLESVQSAVVTGPEGEEIWVDEYGRVKIQFKWDRQWPNDDTSSCWVRVQQGWAGNNWGVLFTPRIGMEVMVSFINGNPNRPVITGCLYNSDHMPPYLAERVTDEHTPTKSGIKTRSSKEGGAGPDAFNELRFEDKSGAEQIYIRAQKDKDTYVIENETKHIEKGSSWLVIDQGDRNVVLEGGGEAVAKTSPEGQELPAGVGDDNLILKTGSRATSFMSGDGPIVDTTHIIEGLTEYQNDKGSMSRVFQEGNDKTTIVAGNREVVIKEGNDFHKILTGDRQTVIETGNRTDEIETGDRKTLIDTGSHLTQIKTGDHKLKVDTGNIGVQIDEGNEVRQLNSGNYKLTLADGDKEVTIEAGDTILTLTGDKKEDVTGNYEGTYTEEFSLTVTGAIAIVSEDSISITSSGDLELTADGDISMDAGGYVKMTSAGDTIIESDGDLEATSSGDMTLASEGDTAMTSDGDIGIESGGDTNITSDGAVNIESSDDTLIDSGGALDLVDGDGLTIDSGGDMSVTSDSCDFEPSSFSVTT